MDLFALIVKTSGTRRLSHTQTKSGTVRSTVAHTRPLRRSRHGKSGSSRGESNATDNSFTSNRSYGSETEQGRLHTRYVSSSARQHSVLCRCRPCLLLRRSMGAGQSSSLRNTRSLRLHLQPYIYPCSLIFTHVLIHPNTCRDVRSSSERCRLAWSPSASTAPRRKKHESW